LTLNGSEGGSRDLLAEGEIREETLRREQKLLDAYGSGVNQGEGRFRAGFNLDGAPNVVGSIGSDGPAKSSSC
jgi:hypothetical protein